MDPPPFRRHPRPLRCFLCRAWKCAFGAQGLHPSRLAVAEVKQAGRKLVRRRRPPDSYAMSKMSKTSKDLAPGCNSICLPSPLLLLSHSAVGGPKAVHPARRRPVEQCRLASSAQPVAALPARRDQDSDVRLGSPCRPTFRIHRPGLQPGRPPPSSLRIWRVDGKFNEFASVACSGAGPASAPSAHARTRPSRLSRTARQLLREIRAASWPCRSV